ncbi:MAG: penicillin-binding transpeptidase domain-containing protein [Terricaulis sp.]
MDRQGAVRALIGGTDYGESKFDRVVQARRQPGSAFKTFVYTAALENGLGTEDVRYDEPIVIDGWRPRNYDEGYRGAVTLRTAFALSLNTVAAEVADEVGPENVARRRAPARHHHDARTQSPRAAVHRAGLNRSNLVGHDDRVRRVHGGGAARCSPISWKRRSIPRAMKFIAARRSIRPMRGAWSTKASRAT